MTIIVYECDTCNRQIEKLLNPEGLEVINNCNITLGCKGKLHKIDELTGYVSPSLPPSTVGLTDWSPRKVLYTHTQDLLAESWTITHNLNTSPSIQVFVNVNDTLTEIVPKEIELVNSNQVILKFTQAYTGIAQVIARSSTDGQSIASFERPAAPVSSNDIQITTSNILTIATLYDVSNTTPAEDFVDISIVFLEPNTFDETAISGFIFDTVDLASPWNDVRYVTIDGKLYKVRSSIIDPAVLTSIRSGSPFYFGDVIFGTGSPTAVASGDIFILESDPPYQLVDKQYDRAVDLALIDNTATTLTSFRNKELFINEQIFTNIFPLMTPIKV